MATPPRPPNSIPKRVLLRWERLVGRAMAAAETRAGQEQGDSYGTASNNAVPQSLLQQTNIDAILQTADELQTEYPEVGRILCEYAYSLSQNLDPSSDGRGVLQFKTGLLSIIKQKRSKNIGERVDRSKDIDIIQQFYKDFREKNGLEDDDRVRRQTDSFDADPVKAQRQAENRRKVYATARILNDVVNAYEKDIPEKGVDSELKRKMEEDAKKLEGFKPYNILPLETPGVANAFENFPEVTGATRAIEYNAHDLPQFPEDFRLPEERTHRDVFDFLQYVFGFQEDNVTNQREHLILLLSNSQSRLSVLNDTETKLDDAAIIRVHAAWLDNYERWCKFLRKESMSKRNSRQSLQSKVFQIALYLLIWGEAANLRFLPECLCYIFHQMAYEMFDLLALEQVQRSKIFLPDSPHSFLDRVIKPVHEVLAAEAKVCAGGNAPHSAWRNYDDFNEHFWAPSCFELAWPWRLDAGFFVMPKKVKGAVGFKRTRTLEETPLLAGQKRERKVGKTQFVEHRTGLHLYHSFHRLWIFLVCMLQGLAIFAFSNRTLSTTHLKYILSVGPTFVIMKFIQSVLDVLLMTGAYRSTRTSTVFRILIRFLWFASLSAIIVYLYVRTLEEQDSGSGSNTWFRIFYWVLGLYAGVHFFLALILRIPWFRLQAESCSNSSIVQFIKWVHEERYYVGRGMYEKTSDYLKYTMFWLVIGACKFSFSYFLQIQPMVAPTRIIIDIKNINYRWRDLVSKSNHNALTLVSLWAPVVMIYFLDLQVWYTVISALVGGLDGAVMGLGEIRSLETLRTRFTSLPTAFIKRLQPSRSGEVARSVSLGAQSPKPKLDAIRFSPIWNEIIISLREEDLINNREKEWLLMPDNKITPGTPEDYTLVQWPLFLLANKVYVACDTVKENKGANQEELWDKIGRDPYLMYAVQEAYDSLRTILLELLNENGCEWVKGIYNDMNESMSTKDLKSDFNLERLTSIVNVTAKLTEILSSEPKKNDEKGRKEEESKLHENAVRALQDLFEVVMQDFVWGRQLRYKYEGGRASQDAKDGRLFNELTWPTGQSKVRVCRLNNILTIKDSALNVPRNLDARRRLEFFSNSLFMSMPDPPPVRNMFSFSVFTPYFAEDVMYNLKQLIDKNNDGISMLYYLQTINPDEWGNFLERLFPIKDDRTLFLQRLKSKNKQENEVKEERKRVTDIDGEVLRELCLWASYRGQTLARTVRGMMYYKRALILQAQQEGASLAEDEEQGTQLETASARGGSLLRSARAQAELKFLYVVSAQIYGAQKNSTKPDPKAQADDKQKAADISYLMRMNDSLRIGYIHKEEDSKGHTEYYSKLIKADPSGKDQEVYSIKLPGEVILGEGKPENQNHAIIFTRGEALQTIDMNQEHYLEETLKMRNLLEEFVNGRNGLRNSRILGVREHVFTGSISSLAWFMSLQERSFVTLGQRVLAKPLKVRMHYGHPDVFDRTFHVTRGGISKPSKQINLSEDIFAGFNSTLRQGNISHHEYIQCGKGRDVGLNQIAAFEGKVASGNGEQTLSRDIYRLGQLFDFFRAASFFFTTVGYYFTTMLTVLTVYVFLYGKVYLALSGVDAALKANGLADNKALQSALDTQFLLQIGVFTAVPMIMNFILEEGALRALISFVTMQLQMSSIFFTFSLGTRTHYFGRTILHGGAKYKSTGRGFVIKHISFAENYRLYSRSHFVKAMEIIMLLIVILVYGGADRTAVSYILLTFSSWFLAISWLYAPYIFNPSGFEWTKIVHDFEDWTNWLFLKGGIGDKGEKSWEVWWKEEHAHIQTTRGRIWEIILSLRFFLIQYGVAYALHVTGHDKDFRVYGYSWLVFVGVLLLFKVFTFDQKTTANFQLVVRLLQGLIFMAIIAGVVVAVVLTTLTIGDVFASALALIPTGWGLLSIAIAIRPVMENLGLWKSIRAIARLYDAFMGVIVFIPIAVLSWFPFVSTFQTRLVFNQAFSRGLEISVLLAGDNPNANL